MSKALTDTIRFNECKLVSTYLVDVEVYKYDKDWEEVSELATQWFVRQKLLEQS